MFYDNGNSSSLRVSFVFIDFIKKLNYHIYDWLKIWLIIFFSSEYYSDDGLIKCVCGGGCAPIDGATAIQVHFMEGPYNYHCDPTTFRPAGDYCNCTQV